MLIANSKYLFSKIKETKSLAEAKKCSVWKQMITGITIIFLMKKQNIKIKRLGKQMIDNIIINTVVPTLFAYGLHHEEEFYKEKVIKWPEEVSLKKNAITKGFESLHFSNKNAFDSQAFIQLKNEYCNHKLCLQCAVGNSF